MFQYHGFGLDILSEIEFPELQPAAFINPDVTITIGKVPEQLQGETYKRAFSIIGDDEYILTIKNISRYYTAHGNAIIVEPVEGIDLHSVRLFLLGTVMAMITYQRGRIPLHASGIIKNDNLILFTGNSGAGKSTTLAAFEQKGYEIFTDDVCVLDADENVITGTSSYPMMKLWEDSIKKLGEENYARDFTIRPQLPKYGQFFHDVFTIDAVPVSKIFILCTDNSIAELSVKKLNNIDAFQKLEAHAYRKNLITGNKLRLTYFKLLNKIAKEVEVYEVHRPLGKGNTIKELTETIEKLF